ncbi:hypothetical protein [Lentzea sp. NPDC003310]|uniref:hypothetical protein n=1 Tax=Lentzea sp. NPDC003310 TaxID=3154447 RepID=UPI0033BCACDD
MELVPVQWASLIVIAVDALVIVAAFLTGSPMLPRSANVVLVVIAVVMLFVTLSLTGGGFNFDNPTLPAFAVVTAAVAFLGGGFLFAYALTVTSGEQNDAVLAANQRGAAGLAAALAAIALLYAGVRHRR